MMPNDLNKMLEQLQGMQDQFAKMQAELGSVTAMAESGGGMVRVTANGRQEVISIKIEKEVIDPAEQEMLEDLIVAAVNRALQRAKEVADARMNEAAQSFLPGGFPPMQ